MTDTGPPGARDRGLLVIAPRVVERIAARVAGEVDGVAGDNGVRADAILDGPTAAIALRLGVTYPRPVGRVASEVRRRVSSRVPDLTGLAVDAVRVTVDELVLPGRSR